MTVTEDHKQCNFNQAQNYMLISDELRLSLVISQYKNGPQWRLTETITNCMLLAHLSIQTTLQFTALIQIQYASSCVIALITMTPALLVENVYQPSPMHTFSWFYSNFGVVPAHTDQTRAWWNTFQLHSLQIYIVYNNTRQMGHTSTKQTTNLCIHTTSIKYYFIYPCKTSFVILLNR